METEGIPEEEVIHIQTLNQKRDKLPAFYSTMVIGPSGSGKTTFCHGLQQFYEQIDRKHIIINLDPANDVLQYKCDIDIRDLIELEDVMEEFKLGPNGALVYCMNFLAENTEWLINQILQYKDHYLIFDLPGQIELYLNSESIRKVIESLQYSELLTCEIVLAELFDSHYCYDKHLFISICMQAITSMINLELPHINILTKIDMMKLLGKPDLPLEKYLAPYDISHIFEQQEENSKFNQKYKKLDSVVYEIIEDENTLCFQPLDIQNKVLLSNIISILDKSNGYSYAEMRQKEKFEFIRNDISRINGVFGEQLARDLEDELFAQEDETIIDKQPQQQPQQQYKIAPPKKQEQIIQEAPKKQNNNSKQKKSQGFGGLKKGFFG